MADIEKITASNGTTYNIKDSTARDSISQIQGQGTYDLNELTTTALLYCTSSSTNKPGTRSGGVVVIAYGASGSQAVTQLFIEAASSNAKVFHRCKASGSWTEWTQL